VSNANEDFPLPLSPVKTISLCKGISNDIFFKLCTLAPSIIIFSLAIFSTPNQKNLICKINKIM